MKNLTTPTKIYFEESIYQALKQKSATSNQSLSEIVDEAVRILLDEDLEDIIAIADRADEPEISYEQLLVDINHQNSTSH